MPVSVAIYQMNGKADTVRLPVEIWQRGSEFTFKYDSSSRLDSVVIDPDYLVPDMDRSNNKWFK